MGGAILPKTPELHILQNEWYAAGLSTNEPDRFQGFHEEHILVVVDEASGVNEEIFEAIDGVLTSARRASSKRRWRGSSSKTYIMADELYDEKIYRAMFLPSLLASGENGGSYSLGKVHLGLFEQTARAMAADYADAELEQVWRPLIEWGFGLQDGYGEIQIADEVELLPGRAKPVSYFTPRKARIRIS